MLGLWIGGSDAEHIGIFAGHVIGTCAFLYILFFWRLLGAGDIKLMAVCVGFLGIRDGLSMIFYGIVIALIVECLRAKVWKNGWYLIREQKVRLAPYVLLGYGLFAALNNGMTGGVV